LTVRSKRAKLSESKAQRQRRKKKETMKTAHEHLVALKKKARELPIEDPECESLLWAIEYIEAATAYATKMKSLTEAIASATSGLPEAPRAPLFAARS
jgi:hypothetical protein